MLPHHNTMIEEERQSVDKLRSLVPVSDDDLIPDEELWGWEL